MGKILGIIEHLSGGACYQTEKFSLDHYSPLETIDYHYGNDYKLTIN